jgi:hypothetical protein
MFKLILVLLAIPVVLIAALALWLCYQLCWVGRSRRRREGGFDYVYVNLDGTAGEVSNSERAYLAEEFAGADSSRPYIKSHYEALDGWGNISGFILRRQLPADIAILPVDPKFESSTLSTDDFTDMLKQAGMTITDNLNGSVTCSTDPTVDPKVAHERFALLLRERKAEGVKRK